MSFTVGRLVRRSAWFHRSIGLAVALGVAAATAVVCGALLVGDSMRGSLRGLTLQRLGEVDAAVMPGSFFSAAQVAGDLGNDAQVVPVIYFARGVLEATDPDEALTRRSGQVQLIAAESQFWDFDTAGVRPEVFPSGNQVVLNQRAADELQVTVGDLVTVRLPAEQAVPADSPLGRRDHETEGLPRLQVVAIVPNQGLGRFGLQPSQAIPLCCYLPLELVQQVLDRPGQANTLLVALPDAFSNGATTELAARLRPELNDFGLQLERVTREFEGQPSQTLFDYYSLSSERLLLSDQIVETIVADLGNDQAQPVLTYLANAIESPDGERSIPYSTLTAINSSSELPLDFSLPDGVTAEIPIVLNSWAAEQLNASVGDELRIAYFEPETTTGKEVERYFAAVLTSIVPITEPSRPYRRSRDAEFDQPPTVYNDPALTPTVPGITDQDSINDWDLPFKLERDISGDDDDYWSNHRLTPKAFIPLSAGRDLFGSRFGNTTSLRIDHQVAESAPALAERIVAVLRSRQTELGFDLLPIKAQQLAASRGTTPFDALFLSLSFFVIVAALMLVALLFRLGLQQRAAEYGVMLAVGIPGRQVSRIALVEGTLLAIPGALLGVVAGVIYALVVLWALSSWWVGAVTVPFLEFHWRWTSVLIGLFAGIVMAAVTIALTARRLRRVAIRPLLAGQIPEADAERPVKANRKRSWRWFDYAAGAAFVIAVGLGIMAIGLSGPAQAGAFVGGGMLLLSGVLMVSYSRLSAWQASDRRAGLARRYSVSVLAFRAVGRNPLRSTLSIGLMAVACFLIVSMSAFQMRPSTKGVGGFDLMGQSALPIYQDLNDPVVREELLRDDAPQVTPAEIFGLRYRPGQDASCNNLYQAFQPQVLGIPSQLTQWYSRPRAGSEPTNKPQPIPFDWAAEDRMTMTANELETPWALLEQPATGTADDPVPVILDQNTAMWSLQMRSGVGEVRGFTFDDGRERHFRVVALLANSVLQGSLIIGEQNFQQLFPEVSGYSFFLVQAGPAQDVDQLAAILENQLGDSGMDMVSSRQVLAGLMAVQNTYLKTFQSLGALGLLLGTFGLAVVQLRNVLERRGELALLRAVGFSKQRLMATVLLENLTLLLGGIACGAGAALAAVVPYMWAAGTRPAIVEPLLLLGLVFVVGLAASTLALRRVTRLPLLANL
ncbi:FtsX-like permease family protein [Planctomycetaceae bacterium SH139]